MEGAILCQKLTGFIVGAADSRAIKRGSFSRNTKSKP